MESRESLSVERVSACLLGGAVGDALGAPVEFFSWAQIVQHFGDRGVTDLAPAYGRIGAITDDTQMMLFTAEGMLRAWVRASSHGLCIPYAVVHHALMRWFRTQGGTPQMSIGEDGWLIKEPRLWSRRAPGNTCLGALQRSSGFGQFADNDSKGCGGVMRVAPCAFLPNAFDNAAESARLTHGHPSGYLAAGLFADLLALVWQSPGPLAEQVGRVLERNSWHQGMDECRAILTRVLALHAEGIQPTPEGIEALGGGWVAEEALAIGLWCALAASSYEQGVLWAVNHSGDSDSTGMIAGHLLGLIHGLEAIPERWLEPLELRDVIEQLACDIVELPSQYRDGRGPLDEWWWERYPGW